MVGRPPTLRSTQPDTKRGYATSWIQTTATVGMLVALVIIGLCRYFMDAKDLLRLGLAHSILVLDSAPANLDLYPLEAAGITHFSADEVTGQTFQTTFGRQFL